MPNEIRIYTPRAPKAAASDDAAVESALRLPKLIDNEIIISESASVSPEDIPAAVLFACPGLRYLTRVSLACVNENDSGNLKAAEKFAKGLVDALDGAMLLPGSESPIVGSEAPKYVIPQINSYTPMLTLTCHFLPTDTNCYFAEELVSALEEILPAALPELYGTSDAPEFKYAEQGREHLINFLKTESAPVWYAHSPVTHLFISNAPQNTSSVRFRASRIALTVSAAAWKYDEWQSALHRLLCRLMSICHGFFGQIIESGKLGVAAWWWQGIPQELGYLSAFGEPYKSLIPDCSSEKNISEDPEIAVFDGDKPPRIPQELISVPLRRRYPPRRTDFKPAGNDPLVK